MDKMGEREMMLNLPLEYYKNKFVHIKSNEKEKSNEKIHNILVMYFCNCFFI